MHTGALIKMSHAGFVEAWDPLEPSAGIDLGLVIAAKKREIANILRSYTGYYDLFSELIQNALDAVERRLEEDEAGYAPRIWIEIDLGKHEVRVTDNGCGMSLEQFRQFLSPSFSFKNGQSTRGSKGVGATYLGYGFNSLHVSSRQPEGVFSGKFENGRNWIEDRLGTIARPKIVPALQIDGQFSDLDRGTAVAVMLNGANIRPKNLSWYQAVSATQWLALLRIFTPLGGLYIDGSSAPWKYDRTYER
ncbi:ATP-binding protein [Methylobacterium sp. 174MFSha1.1]|uniref:ATP-binding protein n=1 Tax=Methylobacterium sp. 174MFSha1.1 TaxID=1502749 RepID=UPI0015A6EDAF|nr:ATP-binding protein [Methylobacterium sp. 174MFSha1.1]